MSENREASSRVKRYVKQETTPKKGTDLPLFFVEERDPLYLRDVQLVVVHGFLFAHP